MALKPPKIHFGTRIGPTICLEQAVGWSYCILLMVQKSGVHQLRLVVYPIMYDGFCTSNRWLFGISEPSTVVSLKSTKIWSQKINTKPFQTTFFDSGGYTALVILFLDPPQNESVDETTLVSRCQVGTLEPNLPMEAASHPCRLAGFLCVQFGGRGSDPHFQPI